MRTHTVRILLRVGACLAGLILLGACTAVRQDNPLTAPAQTTLAGAVTPASEAGPERTTRPAGQASSETTLGFNISGWT